MRTIPFGHGRTPLTLLLWVSKSTSDLGTLISLYNRQIGEGQSAKAEDTFHVAKTVVTENEAYWKIVSVKPRIRRWMLKLAQRYGSDAPLDKATIALDAWIESVELKNVRA
jgi:hypothetical protein